MTTLAFYQKLAGQTRITTRAAAQLTGVSIPAASMALRRLAADGMSIALKKGTWLLGTSSPKPGALVTAAADPYVADQDVAARDALNALRLQASSMPAWQ